MSGPVLSLILVVHREQGWLPELASSVLDQTFPDFEVVAIDDASPDHAPAMLDELAERDPRVRVRHLARRVGLGEGRNLGLEMAEGEYLWFVETTDLLPEGALAAVVERRRGSRSDLLLVHHSKADVFGNRRPRATPVAESALHAWNKLFRHDFLRDLGVRFGPGAYSELTVNWPALLSAERIETLPAESYVRREPPNAVSEGSPFDVFDQYDAVFEFGAADARRELIVPAMLRHELSMLARLSDDRRAEFFRRMSEGYRRHRRGGEPSLGLRARLVERGDYRAYRLFENVAGLKKHGPERAKRAQRRAKRVLRIRRSGTQRHYRARLKKPIDPNLAVFAAYWYRGYLCNPRAIYEKARELVPSVHGVWVVNTHGAQTVPEGVEYVMAGTHDYYDVIARAKWFVNNVNFPNNLVKREGTVHVMTHHGTPLKRMGLDQTRRGAPALLRRCARWDFSISQNAFTTPIWERTYPMRYESLEVGYPRNDVLVNAGDDEVERIRAELGIANGRKAVLYAPTHREYLDGYVPMLDLSALSHGLGGDWLLLARAHYFYDSAELHGREGVLDVSAHPSIEELCLAADVLVTDYSSIMFDYAALDRPIVIHAPDWEEYRARRGTYFDLMAEPPGVISRSDGELLDALQSGAAFSEDSVRLRSAFRARFCHLDDGHAADRVVRRVWLDEPLESPATPAAAPAP